MTETSDTTEKSGYFITACTPAINTGGAFTKRTNKLRVGEPQIVGSAMIV